MDSIHILVEDEGVGSNAPDLEHLTQPFQRGENSEHAAGFGMGLTIVSSIAVDHGGALPDLGVQSINLYSASGGGVWMGLAPKKYFTISCNTIARPNVTRIWSAWGRL